MLVCAFKEWFCLVNLLRMVRIWSVLLPLHDVMWMWAFSVLAVILMPSPLLEQCEGIVFTGSPCVWQWSYTKSSLTQYHVDRLWEFHQIYNFGAVGHKDELIGFWGQKFKGQGHSEAMCGQVRTLGDICWPISSVHARSLVKIMAIISTGQHDNW